MKTRTVILLSALACSFGMSYAQEVDADAAKNLAHKFFTTHAENQRKTNPSLRIPAKADPVLSYTAVSNGTPDFYVFNRGANTPGFVIVNAHGDAETPILAYADNTNFDYDQMPDNLRWWISQYQQYGAAKVSPNKAKPRKTITPIIETQWGQDDPFNRAIPTLSSGNSFVTGCVATAMAQVMKHYNYPIQGRGAHTYSLFDSYGRPVIDFTANFGETTYDWDNMLNSYSHGSSAEEANAVAQLMYHAGVSVDMVYGSSGSTSDARLAATALATYFDYDRSILQGSRQYYTDAAWEELVYNELAEGRPILYSGASGSTGHAFVCHGYDASTGLFAINWGWDGQSDGYYALTGYKALQPDEVGIGGGNGNGGYVDAQSIIYNIRPNEGAQPTPQLGTYGEFKVANDAQGSNIVNHLDINRAIPNSDKMLYFNYNPLNCGSFHVEAGIGVMLRNVINGTTYHSDVVQNIDLDTRTYNSFPSFFSFSTAIAPCNGTYEIIPAFTSDNGNTWQPMFYPAWQTVPTVTIKGGEPAERVEVPMSISNSSVEVGKTLTISHSPYYTGRVNYSSSDATIASVSTDGVITAHSIGTATITANAVGDEAFMPTETTFTISVVKHMIRPYEFSVETSELKVGETTPIYSSGYTGAYKFTSVPEGVVTVDADGTIHAVAPGDVTLFIAANEADYDHCPTTTAFTFHVSEAFTAPTGFGFSDMPSLGKDNIFTSENMIINLPIVNNGNTDYAPAVVYYDLSLGFSSMTGSTGYKTLHPGQGGVAHLDLSNISSVLTAGKTYSVKFYADQAHTTPLNVPSLTFSVGKSSTITLQHPEGTCSTLSLPFTASIPEGLKAYEVDAFYNEMFRLAPVNVLEKNHSYIITGEEGQYTFTGATGTINRNPTWRFMTGIQYETTVPTGSYIFATDGTNLLRRTTNESDASKWSAYISLPDVKAEVLPISLYYEEYINGITSTLAPSTATAIYSLDGRRLSTLSRGINIVNGKKVFVR